LSINSDFVIGQYCARISRESSRTELNRPKVYGHIVLCQQSLQGNGLGDEEKANSKNKQNDILFCLVVFQ